jgi:hypothetical protein
MGRARAHAEKLIHSRPTAIYDVLADYSTHHPKIMPTSLFSDLQVEAGGVGAGTVFHITANVLGRRQRLHMKVSEPEPGRVITETNIDTGVVTAFTVATGEGESITRTRISSEWETNGGVRGLFDRLVTPRLMSRIFARQLRELSDYMDSMGGGQDDSPLGRT